MVVADAFITDIVAADTVISEMWTWIFTVDIVIADIVIAEYISDDFQ